MSEPVLDDADRFLIFMAMLDPEQAKPKDRESLIRIFGRMTGWEESRVVSAFDVCAIRGFIDK